MYYYMPPILVFAGSNRVDLLNISEAVMWLKVHIFRSLLIQAATRSNGVIE